MSIFHIFDYLKTALATQFRRSAAQTDIARQANLTAPRNTSHKITYKRIKYGSHKR